MTSAFYKYILSCLVAVFLYNFLMSAKSSRMSEISDESGLKSAFNAESGLKSSSPESESNINASNNPLPVYFVSHGGPTFMYKDDDFGNAGAYGCLQKLGRKITRDLKPDYILMVSAHWQSSGSNLIEIAVPPKTTLPSPGSQDLAENPLIYDFYGFPDYMYKEKFRSQNSRFISEAVKNHLEEKGFSSRLTERGIDHGVWVPSVVMFSSPRMQPKSRLAPVPDEKRGLDLDIPLVQVSLTALDGDFDTHYKLGQALSHFRENLIYSPEKGRHLKGLVICSGMSVHNLRDLGVALRTGKPMPYAKKFNKAIDAALKKPDFLQAFKDLKTSEKALLKQAHPTLEHFVPLVVAGGSVQDANIKELYNDEQLSLGWGVYEFSTKEH